MTGHFVLSTLHTNNAATTLPRLIDMGIEPFLVTSSVNVIIAQRLVRKICPKCRETYTIQLSDFKKRLPDHLLEKLVSNRDRVEFYHGRNCELCAETGYLGRIGIFEVLKVEENIGMTTMFEDGIKKVLNGITTVDEILRVARE